MTVLVGASPAVQDSGVSELPLPLGEAGRRPGEGAFLCERSDESTLTPALSQREREKNC